MYQNICRTNEKWVQLNRLRVTISPVLKTELTALALGAISV